MSVYFIGAGRYFKIGYSENPQRRFERLHLSGTRYTFPADASWSIDEPGRSIASSKATRAPSAVFTSHWTTSRWAWSGSLMSPRSGRSSTDCRTTHTTSSVARRSIVPAASVSRSTSTCRAAEPIARWRGSTPRGGPHDHLHPPRPPRRLRRLRRAVGIRPRGGAAMTTPTALRDAGMDQATEHADMRLVAMVDGLIAEFNASGMPWSANDLRDRVPMVGQGLVGARVKAAYMRRPVEMTQVGWTRSTLRSTHAKPIAVWQGHQSPVTASPPTTSP